jgi:signal transduction histidine kinase
MKIHGLKLSTKFSLTVGAILLFFCIGFSIILYHYLKNQVLKDAEEKTMIIMSQIKSVGAYVRETLRPAMFESLSRFNASDKFIVEAMSTTHVSLQVMGKFNREVQDFGFARVSEDPMNPNNKADKLHLSMIDYFRRNKDKGVWMGVINTEKGKTLFRVRPIIMEKECLRCHGNPKDAPKELLLKYGASGGFGRKVGEIIGVESVSYLLDSSLANVKRIAFDTFFFGISTLGILFLALQATFVHLVTRPLNTLAKTFRDIVEGKQRLGNELPNKRTDEIGDLTASFNTLSRHLFEAEEKLKKTAEIEKQMMETEKLASLGQLSAGIAHEINNPLGGIRLCFNNLIKIDMNEKDRNLHIATINAGLDRIQKITKQLLDFAKGSPLSMKMVSICEVLDNVLQLSSYLLSKKSISVIREFDNTTPLIKADGNKLEQVFLNLIINAVHATDTNGTITVRCWRGDDYCGVSITDTGRGIPESIRHKIFDPFFTTKGVQQGTGLGLTVAKSIVEQHRGSITFETSQKGTTFTVRLPIQ